MAEIRLPTMLRKYADGKAALSAEGETLAAVFADVARQHPDLGAQLVTKEGTLHKFMNVYVGDDDVRFRGGLDASVESGDTVTILPAVAGG